MATEHRLEPTTGAYTVIDPPLTDPPPYDTDLPPAEEGEMWQRFNAAQLLTQYSDADAVYDQF